MPYAVNLSQPLIARDRHKVQGGQGVMLSVQEWGNPTGPTIRFAHAYGMSHLAWIAQITSLLTEQFRLITFDHRGHGESDKPLTADGYDRRDLFVALISVEFPQIDVETDLQI